MTEAFSPCARSELQVLSGRSLPEFCEIQHTILENSGQAILATDAAGMVIYFNPAAQRLLGYAKGEMLGRSLSGFLDAGEARQRARELSRVQQRQIVSGFDVLIAQLVDDQAVEQDWTCVRQDG
jgi:PAS domain-containing protein